MAPSLIVIATLIVLIIFVSLTQGPEAGLGISVLVAVVGAIVLPLTSRLRSRSMRNLRRVTLLIWALTLYCWYQAGVKEDVRLGMLTLLGLIVAGVLTVAYWSGRSDGNDSV
ncbi:hypothetical protein PLANPX_4355 [Lacipirellula parvula]|uniref:Uncharacterized protein n=1 Tax=Lacipirellula parvula TaxID=2650471 RepID=A0A5K7XKE6_9BACT|nr:hypothetical protein PLANPX_4355 [Lacipirellula parvula]